MFYDNKTPGCFTTVRDTTEEISYDPKLQGTKHATIEHK